MPRKKGDLPLNVEETEKVKSLAALGYSTRHIGREVSRSPHTVAKLLKTPTVAAEVVVKRLELSDLYEKLSRDTLESITKETIEDASLLQRATSAGIFTDKSRLLKGESTINVGVDVLLSIAAQFRRESAVEDESLAEEPQRVALLPAPAVEPIATPIPRPAISEKRALPAPVQSKTELRPPAPSVKYTPVIPGQHPDHCPPENPLMRGNPFCGKT